MPTIIKYREYDPRNVAARLTSLPPLIPVTIEYYLPEVERAELIRKYSLDSKKELIKYCKEKGWKKYSKYNKKELVIWILDKKIEESGRLRNL